MPADPSVLSERERDTLRRLLDGHDAKSIARDLGLSVHTINERLRDARRKMGVSSSREAARILLRAEGGRPPQSVGDTALGMATGGAGEPEATRSGRRHGADDRVLWLFGGVAAMLGIVAAMFVSVELLAPAPVAAGEAPAPAAEGAARAWLALLDAGRWARSWDQAGGAFRSRLDAEQWAATVAPLRASLGLPASRRVDGVTRTSTLPAMPAGDYELIQFDTAFRARPGAVETVVLSREDGKWRVVGYFVR